MSQYGSYWNNGNTGYGNSGRYGNYGSYGGYGSRGGYTRSYNSQPQDVSAFVGNGRTSNGKRICLLDLNYTLVGNQAQTRSLRPFSKRMEQEEYRKDLIEAIRDDYVIIITARPDYQMRQTMENVFKKTGWKPDEVYFNDINAEPPVFKESALKRFVFPKHGEDGSRMYAVESNPVTRQMYDLYGIGAQPYVKFIRSKGKEPVKIKKEDEPEQLDMFSAFGISKS